MKQEFVTLPRTMVERALEHLTCEVDKPVREAFRAALEQPQGEQEQASTNTWSTADGIRCLHCHLPLSSHSEQRYCQRVEDGSQANQPAMTPIAQRKLEDLVASGYTISGYSIYHEQRHQHGFVTGAGLVGWWKPEGVEYPKPQGGQGPTAEHKLKDVRCECCGYMTHHREHMGCIRVAHTKREPLTNEQVKAGLIQSIEYTDARERCAFNIGVRFAERAHNIK